MYLNFIMFKIETDLYEKKSQELELMLEKELEDNPDETRLNILRGWEDDDYYYSYEEDEDIEIIRAVLSDKIKEEMKKNL